MTPEIVEHLHMLSTAFWMAYEASSGHGILAASQIALIAISGTLFLFYFIAWVIERQFVIEHQRYILPVMFVAMGGVYLTHHMSSEIPEFSEVYRPIVDEHCPPVLEAIATGELRKLQPGLVVDITRGCGQAAFAVAINSPDSVFEM